MSTEDYVPSLKGLLADGKVWATLGVVKAPEGESHYEISDDDGDVYVDVELTSGEQVLCRLGAAGSGGPGLGLFCVPPVGAEVAVLVPRGDIEADCVIVAVLSSGTKPDGLDGSGTAVLVVKSGATVLVHDGDAGDAVPLTKKGEHVGHKHGIPPLKVVIAGGSSAGTYSVVPDVPGTKITDTDGAPDITGTQVLKAK